MSRGTAPGNSAVPDAQWPLASVVAVTLPRASTQFGRMAAPPSFRHCRPR